MIIIINNNIQNNDNDDDNTKENWQRQCLVCMHVIVTNQFVLIYILCNNQMQLRVAKYISSHMYTS